MKPLQLNLKDKKIESLIHDNYGLLVSQALSFKPKCKTDIEDYIQIAVIAFIKAVDKFDPNKAKFSTYISSCIRNAIYDYLGKNKKHTFQPLKKNVRVIPSEQFWELMPDNLTSEEKSVIMLKLESYSKAEIAIILDCTQKEVTELFKKAKKKIRTSNET